MTFYLWSRTASADANADPTINWAEGMAPSAINNSGRAMMAATAKYRDDISGSIVTTGTSTAYVATSNQQFDTLAHMSGMMVAITPHTTNSGASCTLNVDSLGAKPIRSSPGVDIPAGTIIQGTPYVLFYNNTDGAFYLHGFYGSPYNIPIGATLDYWLPTAPNSSFVFPFGQEISRTTYATLFAAMGTTYGTGNGTTTFNLPDLRGRATACLDNMGGTSADRLAPGGALSAVRHTLGGAGGECAHTLTAAELPTLTSTGSNSISVQAAGVPKGVPVTQTKANVIISSVGTGGGIGIASTSGGWTGEDTFTGINSISVTSSGTSGSSHNNIQPTILCNRIMRII